MEVLLLNNDFSLLRTSIGGRKNEHLLGNMQLYKDSLSREQLTSSTFNK